jgi:hypothetical protein
LWARLQEHAASMINQVPWIFVFHVVSIVGCLHASSSEAL